MVRRKLKRDRGTGLGEQNHLFGDEARPLVELRKPTREEPAIRRYHPPHHENTERKLAELGVIDARRGHESLEISRVASRIVCGDAASVLKLIPSDSVHCIVTSPPYWNTVDYGFDDQIGQSTYECYLDELLAVWAECERVLVPNGKLAINAPILPMPKAVIGNQHTRHLKNLCSDIEATILRSLSLQRYSLYIWQKQTTEKMFGSYPYPPNLYEQNTVEFISVFVKPGQPRKLDKAVKEASRLTEQEWMNLTRQVWPLYPEDIKRARHPAPFPESLPNRLTAMYTFKAVKNESFDGDIVLDPFCGTGATCLAAKRLSRRYVAIDLSPHFCIEAATRLAQARPTGKVFLVGDAVSKKSAPREYPLFGEAK